MSKRFRAAIIGCGAIAGGYDFDRPSSAILTHAKAYKSHSSFDLIACVDPDVSKRNDFMKNWNIPYGYSNLYDLDGHFDVVSVCTPTATHAEILNQLLLLSNSVVWTEKPLTDNLEDSKQIVSNYEKNGRALVVNYSRRWALEIQKFKSSLEKKVYGNIQKAVVFYSRGLLNNGSHAIDLLEYLLGPLVPVNCLMHGSQELIADQNFDVQLSTMDDKPIYMFGCNADFFSIFEIQMIFEKGRISLLDSGFNIKIEKVIESERFLNYKNLSLIDSFSSGLDVATLNVLKNIYGYLTSSMPLLSTGRTALSVQELCEKLQSMSNQN